MIKEKFTEIFTYNFWGEKESVSGGGSTLEKTSKIIKELPEFLNKYNIKSMLDIPCGDFNWMRYCINENIDYIGGDIVDKIVEDCKAKYEAKNIKFEVLDLTKDTLPKVDLIFCKDCLVHLSYEDALKAIENIKKSGCKYLMVTNYPQIEENKDIETGEWRRINLSKFPFCFPDYVDTLETGVDNTHLSLYEIKDL